MACAFSDSTELLLFLAVNARLKQMNAMGLSPSQFLGQSVRFQGPLVQVHWSMSDGDLEVEMGEQLIDEAMTMCRKRDLSGAVGL